MKARRDEGAGGGRQLGGGRVPRLAKGKGVGKGLSETFQIEVHASFRPLSPPPFPPLAGLSGWLDKLVSLESVLKSSEPSYGFGLHQAMLAQRPWRGL